MKQSPASTAPASYRETYRRYRRLLCLPIIIGGLAAAAITFTATKSYTSTADLWIDTPAPTPSSIGPGSASLSTPPASAEQGILSELLTTPAFAVSVAQHSLLGERLGSEAAIRKNAPTLLEGGKVVPTVTGEQVLQIGYTGSSAAETRSVLAAVVSQLQVYTNRVGGRHSQATVSYDRTQVRVAKSLLATARKNATAYEARHPRASAQNPAYSALVAAESSASGQLGQANTALSQALASTHSDEWAIQVLNPASPGVLHKESTKKMLELIVLGLFGGLVVSLLAVIVLTPAGKEAWEDETSSRYLRSTNAPSTTSLPAVLREHRREPRREPYEGQLLPHHRRPAGQTDDR